MINDINNKKNIYFIFLLLSYMLFIPKISYADSANNTNTPTLHVKANKIVSLDVISGASQKGMAPASPNPGDENWMAVKKKGEFIVVKATTYPDEKSAWDKIDWKGLGQAVPKKDNNYREFSTDSSIKYTVSPTLGTSSLPNNVYLWVVWVDLAFLNSGTTPEHATQFGRKDDATENLGVQKVVTHYSNGDLIIVYGKYVFVGTILPSDAWIYMAKDKWLFKRSYMQKGWKDGKVEYSDTTWIDDTSEEFWQMAKPITYKENKIYDTDGPNGGRMGNPLPQSCTENYVNFKEWVLWNDIVISDVILYHWNSGWDSCIGNNDGIYKSDLGVDTTSQPLPTMPKECVN